jgi:3,4-dihydroxy 2-butanone 4-phosphate synthase/GTP cyclohydrolase II
MARIPDLIPFCREHGLLMLTVAELIRYRLRNERYIVRAGESRIQTKYGEFRMIAYESEVNGGESHIALVRGELQGCPPMRGRMNGAGCEALCWCGCIRAARRGCI